MTTAGQKVLLSDLLHGCCSNASGQLLQQVRFGAIIDVAREHGAQHVDLDASTRSRIDAECSNRLTAVKRDVV